MPQNCARKSYVWRLLAVGVAAVSLGLILVGGCPVTSGDSSTDGGFEFKNDADPTNGGASYIGSVACGACHTTIAATMQKHAHAHALTPILGQAPTFPAEATRAGVPNPPTGLAWTDVSYVISGYLHGAFFVDADGYVLTDGVAGVNTGWQLAFPANGTAAGFAAYLPAQVAPKPYEYETCFRCHTTGPQPQDADHPESQDGRPGIHGTWAEVGVQCEVCHGPGSFHAPQPAERDIYVDSAATVCGTCHTEGDDPDVIVSAAGFMSGTTQYPQLLASGGHSDFACVTCHDPHASITYDRTNGLRNDCTACHTDVNMAFHDGAVFTFGDYTETVNCQSCHMPLAGLSVSSAPASLVGDLARIGDVRAHIFRIDTQHPGYSAMFTADGTAVQKDAAGRAAVTVDFVCLRCHHGEGNVFPLTLDGAVTIARQIHAHAEEE